MVKVIFCLINQSINVMEHQVIVENEYLIYDFVYAVDKVWTSV